MALVIRKPDTPLTIESGTFCIYGTGGTGKTTLVMTSKNAVILDVEGTSYRAENIQGVPVIDTWKSSWAELVQEDLSQLAEYDTIIVDTVGELVRKAMADVIGSGPSHYRQRDGNPTMSGWGALKTALFGWYDRLKETQKNIVFVFQPSTHQDGQIATLDLQVTGATSDFVKAKADMIGYNYVDETGNRHIDFRPIQGQLGKDPLRYGVVDIPEVEQYPHFLGGLIDNYIAGVNKRNEDQGRKVPRRSNDIDTTTTNSNICICDLICSASEHATAGSVTPPQVAPYYVDLCTCNTTARL